MVRKYLTEHIAKLDPVRDHQEILYLLTCHIFPWDIERSLEFALFRTFAVQSISELLVQTGEFKQRTRKRYDDTELLLYELVENGYDSERGRRALRRINQMHGRFSISNADFLYVLSTFVYEPIRWIDHYGWRPLTQNEKLAFFYYYREIARRMNIKDLPVDFEEFERFNVKYENEHFRFAATNREIGELTRDLLLGFYLPKLLWPIGKPFVYTFMDRLLLDAMGFPHPPPILSKIGAAGLRARGWFIKRLPERRSPVLGTRRKRPTYPRGYEIEELGTFPRSSWR